MEKFQDTSWISGPSTKFHEFQTTQDSAQAYHKNRHIHRKEPFSSVATAYLSSFYFCCFAQFDFHLKPMDIYHSKQMMLKEESIEADN